MSVFKPFFEYPGGILKPGVPFDSYQMNKQAEKHEHQAKNKLTYYVRDHELFSVSFSKQLGGPVGETDTMALWWLFRAAVKDGATFIYHDDDSYEFAGGGAIAGDAGLVCGDLSSGGTDRSLSVTIEGDIQVSPDEPWGYWTASATMRVVQ